MHIVSLTLYIAIHLSTYSFIVVIMLQFSQIIQKWFVVKKFGLKRNMYIHCSRWLIFVGTYIQLINSCVQCSYEHKLGNNENFICEKILQYHSIFVLLISSKSTVPISIYNFPMSVVSMYNYIAGLHTFRKTLAGLQLDLKLHHM